MAKQYHYHFCIQTYIEGRKHRRFNGVSSRKNPITGKWYAEWLVWATEGQIEAGEQPIVESLTLLGRH